MLAGPALAEVEAAESHSPFRSPSTRANIPCLESMPGRFRHMAHAATGCL